MIDEQNFFNQPVKHKLTTYDSIQKWHQVKEIIIQLVVF